MSLLHVLGEEVIQEDRLQEYFENVYKVVCVSERTCCPTHVPSVVRTTYTVDWEQLVHLLEDYGGLGEDIVEVARVTDPQGRLWACGLGNPAPMARA